MGECDAREWDYAYVMARWGLLIALFFPAAGDAARAVWGGVGGGG